MRILAIIPARGGSKGIKGKNILDVKGKPLIAYTIEPAKTAVGQGLIDELIISTDSESIAAVGRRHGVSVPFLRPKELSGDTAKAIDYVLHALEFFEERQQRFDAVMVLQPTSPLRTYEDIKAAIDIFQGKEAESLISVYEEAYINDLVMYHKRTDNEEGIPLNPMHNKGGRRQDHKPVYVRNGCIYLTKVHYLRKHRLIISDNPLLYIMGKEQSVNLDTPEDLNLLKKML